MHILHAYPADFYGKELRVVMLGFIRPEYNYSSLGASPSRGWARRGYDPPRRGGDRSPASPHLVAPPRLLLPEPRADNPSSHTDALIKDINHDKLVALHSVSSPSRPAYASFQDDPFFFRPSTLEPPSEDPAKPRVKPGDETGQDGEA